LWHKFFSEILIDSFAVQLKAFVLTATKKPFLIQKAAFLTLFFVAFASFLGPSFASDSETEGGEPKKFNPNEVILHHSM
jgi:hypothetical protein